MTLDRDIFAFAKEVASIAEVAGVKRVGGGDKRRGACPLCGQGQKKGSSQAFVVNVRKKTFMGLQRVHVPCADTGSLSEHGYVGAVAR